MKKTLITLSAAMSAFLAFTLNAQAAYTDDCITFSSAASFTLKTYNASKNWDGTLWTSTDKINWTEWNGALVSAAQTGGTYSLYVRGNTSNTKITGCDSSYYRWVLAGSNIACSGNIETLRGATGYAPSPTQMADYCYSDMFRSCKALTSAPALPATTLADWCYCDMFYGCTSLTDAPALPATTLAKGCYSYMFSYCTSLTNVPALPAMSLAVCCYFSMFSDCTSLTDVPVLPAMELADDCYYAMFSGCTSLTVNATTPGKEWKIPATSTTASDWGKGMFSGTGGTLRGQPELNTTYYVVKLKPNDCVTFSSATVFTLKTYNTAKNWDGKLWTSTDKTNWAEWNGAEVSAAQSGGMYNLYVRGSTSNTKITGYDTNYHRWVLTGNNIACSGNIETLRGATGSNPSPTPMSKYCYFDMFAGCISLTSAPALPATNLARQCYENIFSGCTSLTTAPELPATTLVYGCYSYMFSGCTSLTAAPTLPATTLAYFCYEGMFNGCTSLKAAPVLPVTTLADSCYENMFNNCTSLTTAPALPATTLVDSCYNGMFEGCTALTDAPVLPATTLAKSCYFSMFYGCTSLKDAPVLPVTTLADYCYAYMFDHCTSLTTAPALPAKTMAKNCYAGMFRLCTLKTAPALPATTLAEYCYGDMFYGCTSLTDAPALPATTLAAGCYLRMFENCEALTSAPALPTTTLAPSSCYSGMFSGCTALTDAPELPATTLAEGCYKGMFGDCVSLTSAPALPATTLAKSCYQNMFKGCMSLVVNTTAPGKKWTIPATSTTAKDWGTDMFTGTAGNLQGQPALNTTYYIKSALIYTDDCITFSSAASFSLKTANTSKNWNGTLWTSTDKTYWTEWKGASVAAAWTGGTRPYRLYVRGNAANTKITGCYDGCPSPYRWVLTGSNIACSGNIETLRGATGDNPSQTQMATYCYQYMFYGCTSLTSAPALPAMTLANSCYCGMFQGCTSLTNAPALPATTLAGHCYNGMFENCTALTSAPALPAATIAEHCYAGMFRGCTALTSAPALPATELAWACYASMFLGCTSLTESPALPAATLAEDCYCNMFYDCISLAAAPVLPATTMAKKCYSFMFMNCKALTVAPELPAMTLADGCYLQMFYGCISLKDVPALPATTLAEDCYSYMFDSCYTMEINTTAPGKGWTIPAASTTTKNWGTDMFANTKGTLQGQPELNTTYYIASAPPEPVEPGGEIVVPEGKAEAKAAEINNDPTVKAQYLKAPESVVTTADYLGRFDAVATSGSTVAFVLNENGTNEVVEATAAVNAAALDVVFSADSIVTISEPLVGFYYSLRQGGDVSVGDKADLNKLGGRDIISFKLTKGPLQYFYKTLITPQPMK